MNCFCVSGTGQCQRKHPREQRAAGLTEQDQGQQYHHIGLTHGICPATGLTRPGQWKRKLMQ